MSEQAGFAARERRAEAAWEFFTEREVEMTHEFRGGYHQGFIDGRAQLDEALSILTRLVQQANAQKFKGNVEVDEDGFIETYRMPCGPAHAAIPFLARHHIYVDEFGGVSHPEPHVSEGGDHA